jgi:serine/threonine protein kinase
LEDDEKSLALKRLRPKNQVEAFVKDYEPAAAYETELGALKVFSTVRNKHLIRAKFTFQVGATGFYFAFRWADQNLRELWNNTDPENIGNTRDGTTDAIIWVLEQFEGLTKAIREIHNLGTLAAAKAAADGAASDAENQSSNCRHGDLKPENILLFKSKDQSYGILVIADVGLTRVHPLATKDRRIPISSIAGTERYEPPDVLLGGARSRIYDIWSLGCIGLEFIICLLYGRMGAQRFVADASKKYWFSALEDSVVQEEKSLERSRDGILGTREPAHMLKLREQALGECQRDQQVKAWIDTMKRDRHRRCAKGTALGDLLDLVDTRLLKIPIGDKSTNPTLRRAVADEMHQEVERIYQKVRADPQGRYVKDCAFVSSLPPRVQYVPGSVSLAVPGMAPPKIRIEPTDIITPGDDVLSGSATPPEIHIADFGKVCDASSHCIDWCNT